MFRWQRRLKTGLLAMFAGMLLSACAGGFSEDKSQTSFTTEPTVARCTLQGHNFSATIQTPAQIKLPKDAAPVALSCGAKGHHAFVTNLKPVFNEKIFGNLLLGSLAGLVVDMANGHDTKYPERIHVHMEPLAFASIDARDHWFGRYKNFIAQKWERAAGELTDMCQSDGADYACDSGLKTIVADRAREFESLEQRRRQAHIDVRSTAEWPIPKPATQ